MSKLIEHFWENQLEYIWEDGTKFWQVDGLFHRVGGPAMIWADGHEEWYQFDEYHRDDGPAIIWEDGHVEWWIHGKEVTQSVEKWIRDDDLPPWTAWDDDIWVLFKIRFS